MMNTVNLLLCCLLLLVACVNGETDEKHRNLGGRDVDYDPDVDYCKIGENADGTNIYGACNPEEHFPECSDKEFICYNRINRRDKFYPDKVPHYYIDPIRILCYPTSWLGGGGCSTCTPGRYCLSENRCLIDELVRPCEVWL